MQPRCYIMSCYVIFDSVLVSVLRPKVLVLVLSLWVLVLNY